jgi:hypothetical protein
MAEVINDAQQEFWRSPTVAQPLAGDSVEATSQRAVEACADCGTEYMIGARFCHACGLERPAPSSSDNGMSLSAVLTRSVGSARRSLDIAAAYWREANFPSWLQYLHFHEIQRLIGLPTAAMIAFMIGLGCVAGAIGVSLFYKASNLAEFQAIQMWRIEWLLAATASFVAGILLKKPSGGDRS